MIKKGPTKKIPESVFKYQVDLLGFYFNSSTEENKKKFQECFTKKRHSINDFLRGCVSRTDRNLKEINKSIELLKILEEESLIIK